MTSEVTAGDEVELDFFGVEICAVGVSGLPDERHPAWQELAIDSGCTRVHVCPRKFATQRPIVPSASLRMFSATGEQIEHYGQKRVWFVTEEFIPVSVLFEVANVRQPLLSADRLLE